MKKLIFTISMVLILAFSSVAAFAQDAVVVTIDSNVVEFNNEIGSPFIDENYRTQVPFRATLEKFGAEVTWDSETRTAVAVKDDVTVQVPVGEKYILKDGEKIETDTAALVKDGRTYLPIRPVVEAFGSSVEWDSALNTVVITSTPVDAKKLLMDAYEKSAAWENYEGKASMNMSMPMPGGSDAIKMTVDMDMTAFSNPLKVKMIMNMAAEYQGEKLEQPSMDIYVTMDKDKFVTYMGTTDEEGKLIWSKSTVEDKMLTEMANYDIKTSLETTEKYTKDVKYFGKYTDASGRTLLRIQNTVSGDIYKELLGTYMDQMAASTNTQDALTAEALKGLGDFKFIIFVDEKSGEIVKYEMDLGSIYSSMFANAAPSESMPQEAIDMLKNINATMIMEITNINKAESFEIPKEALEAEEIKLD